jgi:integrase
MAAGARDADVILTTTRGRAWTKDGFRASWSKACGKAEGDDVTFHDLRGSAVTRLFEAGATVAEIAPITGHCWHTLKRFWKRTPLAAPRC